MLTDTKLRNLKPRDKLYKVNDREGLYVGVASENGIYGHSRFCNTDFGTVAKLAMRQPFVLFKGLTFQKLCL
uniref:Arm DNA-binding domain-containing protein n=1 Tax=Enterobacter mori TaxID=539813 RepID=UPI00215D1039